MLVAPALACLLLVAPGLARPPQTVLAAPPTPPPGPRSTTLIDVLNADPDFTSLLRLLQRARLIPTLNRLNGSTLFAPTNDAIERHARRNTLWHAALHDPAFAARDNVQEQLRQELFYHLLNYSLPGLPTDQSPEVHETLHYPRQPLEPPGRKPPPSPPWMPIPGGTLGGKPQRLRVGARDDAVWVGVDAFSHGGAKVVKGQADAGNGIVLGIDDVLPVPPDLATLISQQPALAYLNRILDRQLKTLLNDTAGMTLFLPVDEAWDALHPIERLYLESDVAADDLYKILSLHAVVGKSVQWSDTFEPALNLTTVDGEVIEIVVSPERTMVSSADLVQPDIYASNGVVHTVSSLLIPPGSLRLTPEKFLLALNCSAFVSLLHSVNLTSLVNDTDTKYTILAPQDDVLSLFGDDDIPQKGTEELKKMLKYHFIPGRWTPSKLKDGMLLETMLDEPGLGGGRQVLGVEVSDGDEKGKDSAGRTVRFGGAGIIGDQVEVNNTLIYFVSRTLEPPVDHLQTALSNVDLSTFLASVFSTSLAGLLKSQPRTTLLIPHNSAFKRLGMLVSDYLLSASSRTELERVILHHTLNGVEYAHTLQNGSAHTYPTLEGSDVHVERRANGSVLLSASGGWAGMQSALYPRDHLTETGVIHELSDVMIPRSVDITVGKLVRAAKGTTMASMMAKAGLDWVLEGADPPEGSPWADQGLSGAGWTLLCPTDEAFKKVNLTALYADVGALRDIVAQHLIPSPGSAAALSGAFRSVAAWQDAGAVNVHVWDAMDTNRPLALADSATYTTLRSNASAYGDLVFRAREPAGPRDAGFIVGIKNARGAQGEDDWARVLSWGRTTSSRAGSSAAAGGGGVIQIDALLLPYSPPWYRHYGAPVGVGVGGVLFIAAFFWVVRAVWRRDTSEATYEPIGPGFVDDES